MTGTDPTSGRKPRLRDVAALADVSTATASLVLSGEAASRGRVGDLTRQRVLDAAALLGYQRNQLARGLRLGRTEQVSVVIQNPLAPWTETLIADIARVAETHDYSTIAVVSGDWKQHLLRGIADGAIVDSGWDSTPDLADLRIPLDQGLALVILSNHLEPDGFDVVQASDDEACATAIRYLIDSGRRRIACLRHSPPGHPAHGTRYQTYRETLIEYGLATEMTLVRDFYGSRERAYSAAINLLSSPQPPDAIFATADAAAISAMWAAHRLGIAVPEDLAIIGVGNIAEGSFTDPPLTTVGPHRLDFTTVAQMLFDRLDGHVQPPGRTHRQDWQLIHRGTA